MGYTADAVSLQCVIYTFSSISAIFVFQTTSSTDDSNTTAQFTDVDTEQEGMTTGFPMPPMEMQQEMKSGTIHC